MATVTIKCVDAQTKQPISNGKFELLYCPEGNKRHGKIVKPLKDSGNALIYRKLPAGSYLLTEKEVPVNCVVVEDENCDLYSKVTTYNPQKRERLRFEINEEDFDIKLEYEPKETSYIEPEGKKVSKGKRAYNRKQRKALFERSHELSNKEFGTLIKRILFVAIPATVLTIILSLVLLRPLHFTTSATSSLVLGLIALAIVAIYM